MALTPTRRGVLPAGAAPGGLRLRRLGWGVLALLLAALLVGAAVYGPARQTTGAPSGGAISLPGDGATHAMQAASLAFDFDLTYGREDLDRFVEQWGARPDALSLRSAGRGKPIAFAVPAPLALIAAPVVRLAPVRGLAIVNALLLACAALAAAATLERRMGPVAPLGVAACCFASVLFAHVFRPGPGILAAAAVALAFALAYRGEGQPTRGFSDIFAGTLPGEEAGRWPGRWIGVGALLAVAVAHHPLYGLLALPLAVAAPRGRRRLAAGVLVISLLAGVGLLAGLQQANGGGHLPWDLSGRVFAPETGFPAVDLPVSAWPAGQVSTTGRWLPAGPADRAADASLWGWNLLFLFAGRTFGLLPYFLPALAMLAAMGASRGRRFILPAVALAFVALLWVRPFGLAGAPEAGPANAFALALFPALWFVAARPVRPAWIALTVAIAAPFLYPLWLAPREAAVTGRHVSPVAAAVLPLETTQRFLPGVDARQDGPLWLALVPGGIERAGAGQARLTAAAPGMAELWLGSAIELAAVVLELPPDGPARLVVRGAEPGSTVLRPDGGVGQELLLGAPDRRHPMPWSRGDYALYRLRLALPKGFAGKSVTFEVVPSFEP